MKLARNCRTSIIGETGPACKATKATAGREVRPTVPDRMASDTAETNTDFNAAREEGTDPCPTILMRM
jgi:hypothetical protein